MCYSDSLSLSTTCLQCICSVTVGLALILSIVNSPTNMINDYVAIFIIINLIVLFWFESCFDVVFVLMVSIKLFDYICIYKFVWNVSNIKMILPSDINNQTSSTTLVKTITKEFCQYKDLSYVKSTQDMLKPRIILH